MDKLIYCQKQDGSFVKVGEPRGNMKNVSRIVDEVMTKKALKRTRISLGTGVDCSIVEIEDGQGFRISLVGSFRSGLSFEDTVKELKELWNKFDTSLWNSRMYS